MSDYINKNPLYNMVPIYMSNNMDYNNINNDYNNNEYNNINSNEINNDNEQKPYYLTYFLCFLLWVGTSLMIATLVSKPHHNTTS